MRRARRCGRAWRSAMSDDELRDDFGRDIEGGLCGAAPADTRGPRERVQAAARNRRRARRVAVLGVVVLVVVASVAIARRGARDHVVVSTPPPPAGSSCVHGDAESVVWRSVQYKALQPSLRASGVARLGTTCDGRAVWRLLGYRE